MKSNWTPFRKWVHDLWLENCEEHRQYGENLFLEKEYFQRYKFWLKREYKHQMKAQHGN